ncbi:MAG: hypothetical protein ABSH08_13750 [Tepidisphaeraceae bacterium]|jgi:hypothetical protein
MTTNIADKSRITVDDQEAQLLGKRLSGFVIAYISCPQDAGRNYLGAILLTDYRTRPLEFAFVSPVKVTLMQKIIHGKTLDWVVTVDIIAKRLLSEATKRPDVIFVDSDLLLELQELTDIPVAKLSREQTSASQPTSLSPLKFSTSREGDKENIVGSVLSTIEAYADLMDPFGRMTDAIREAQKNAPPSQAKP